MFLLYNKNKEIVQPILLSILLIVLQGYLPSISFKKGFIVTCDLFFIYLTFLALNKQLYKVIIFAFFIGMFQDLVVQPETVGLYAFIKVVSVFLINYLNKVKNLWNKTFVFAYLLMIYFFHYFLYHFVFITEFSFSLLIYIVVESIFNLIIFIVCDKILFN